jgi:hypothetical protein
MTVRSPATVPGNLGDPIREGIARPEELGALLGSERVLPRRLTAMYPTDRRAVDLGAGIDTGETGREIEIRKEKGRGSEIEIGTGEDVSEPELPHGGSRQDAAHLVGAVCHGGALLLDHLTGTTAEDLLEGTGMIRGIPGLLHLMVAQSRAGLTVHRRRSRSPYARDRSHRDRTPLRRSPPAGPRGGSYRARSRSTSRRGDRYGGTSYRRTPPRDSAVSSAITSQSASRKSSPRPTSSRARSRPQSRERTPSHAGISTSFATREAQKPLTQDSGPQLSRTPPRGPAAFRAPTGPAAGRNFTAPTGSPAVQPPRGPQTPVAPQARHDMTSPTIPPAGPRGYVPPARGGFSARGGRGGWTATTATRNVYASPSPAAQATEPPAIPTGPRAASSNSVPSTPLAASKPFNPPTGPAAHHGGGPRPTPSQNMLATLPPIVPGGKIDPAVGSIPGVTREIEPHYKKLKDEEDRLREDLKLKQEKLRKTLYTWDKLELDSKAWELRSDLSEKSMKNLAGEGMGGASF